MKTTSNVGTNTQHLAHVALFAGTFEWYDFSICGLMAVHMGPLFFSTRDPITAALSFYLVYALSYLARPLGGLFFGSMGDKSRASALKLSLMTMALPTIIIGCLPTYATSGSLATVAFCLLRFIQGFGMGGEFPNSMCYVLDNASARYRALLGSVTCASTSIGISLGSLVVLGLNTFFNEDTILRFAWRIPFLLGIPLTVYIAWVRNTIVDTERTVTLEPSFSERWKRLRETKYSLIKIILLGGMLTTCSNLFLIWMPTYLKLFLNVSPQLASLSNTTTLWFEIATLIIGGYFVPFLPVEKILKVLHVGLLVLIYPLFYALSTYSAIPAVLITTQLVCAFFLGSINSCFIVMITRLLPYDVRSLGASIVFAVSPAVFGGSAPFLSTLFIEKTGLLTAPALIIASIAILALPVTLRLPNQIPIFKFTEK